MWPFMLLVSLAALVMGILNAKHVFGPPAMASSYFNLGSIIGGLAIGWWLDPHFGARSLVGLAIGTLIGGAWQLSGQFPSLWRVGYRYRPDFHWRDEGVRAVLTLMGPAVIAASAVQVNVLINSGFAASLGNGPVSWLNIAFRLMQLPLGIFGVANGNLAGQVRVLKWWNGYAYIGSIVVDNKYRRQGVGRVLIARVVDWAKSKGLPGVMLETQSNNVGACRLYESCGFVLGGFDEYLYKGLNPATDEIALYWYLIFNS